jgi:hypothetical protein
MTTPASAGGGHPALPTPAVAGSSRGAVSPLTGGERLALAMGLRTRGLRGLDVLRRSRDRAPPALA